MTGAAVRLYFHGLPGGAGELALFGRQPDLLTVDRGLPVRGDPAAHFESVAARIWRAFGSGPLHLVGFSLGASAALRTARHLGESVTGIDLVSAAAPLQLGDWLGGMAGAPLFRLAAASPRLFGLAVRGQALASRVAPGALYRALFAGAQGEDALLAADPTFRAGMKAVLAECLGRGAATYRAEMALYVADWRAELADVTQPVRLFHGRADSWAPVGMAEALAERLPTVAEVRLVEGVSHYSMLGRYFADRGR